MIVKTGANYQNDGGYIEASISNDIVTFKTGDIESSVPKSETNVYGALVNGIICLNGADNQIVEPTISKLTEDIIYPSSQVVLPDTETEIQWATLVALRLQALTTTGGYTNPVLSTKSKNCTMTPESGAYYVIITRDDFIIDIVEGA